MVIASVESDAEEARPTSPEKRRLGVSRIVWGLVGAVVLCLLPYLLDDRELFGVAFGDIQLLGITLPDVNLALMAIVGAVALNVLVGRTGLISLGHAAFFAVGAIVAAVTGVQWHWPFLVCLLCAGVVGAVVGIIVGLPSLRLRGLYLMLSTLALHYIAIYLFTEYQLKFFGPSGIPFAPPGLFGWAIEGDIRWYFFLLVFVGLTLLVVRNVNRSRSGMSFVAVMDHELAASAMGMNPVRVRLTSFAFTSFIVSVLGAVNAYYLGFVTDTNYNLMLVVGYFAMVILGGLGSIAGAVLGALVWTLLPAFLDLLTTYVDPATPGIGKAFGEYQSQTVAIVLGLAVILVLRFQPDGLVGILRGIPVRIGKLRAGVSRQRRLP